MNPPVRLGLTGGIGSGKSTVAALLAEAGAAIMDADAISRALTLPSGQAIPAILATFGEKLITPEGAMDREAMRSLVFSDPQAKRQLEAIIHPLVASTLKAQTQAAIDSGKTCLVFDVPLLVESGERWRRQVDWVWVVDCQIDTQVQRVVQRNQLKPDAIQQIIAQQASRAQRLACADAVIYNDGIDLSQLKQQVREMMACFGL
jgi:dephospho-CoA kinase